MSNSVFPPIVAYAIRGVVIDPNSRDSEGGREIGRDGGREGGREREREGRREKVREGRRERVREGRRGEGGRE